MIPVQPYQHDAMVYVLTQDQASGIAFCLVFAGVFAAMLFSCDKDGNFKAK